MRTIEIMFRTNYSGANYNYKFDITCVDVDDLCYAKNAINDYIENLSERKPELR